MLVMALAPLSTALARPEALAPGLHHLCAIFCCRSAADAANGFFSDNRRLWRSVDAIADSRAAASCRRAHVVAHATAGSQRLDRNER
jgi:hypothetical protein